MFAELLVAGEMIYLGILNCGALFMHACRLSRWPGSTMMQLFAGKCTSFSIVKVTVSLPEPLCSSFFSQINAPL